MVKSGFLWSNIALVALSISMSCQRLLWVYLNLVVKKFEVSVTYDLMEKMPSLTRLQD